MHRHVQMGHRGAFVAPSDTIQQPEITLGNDDQADSEGFTEVHEGEHGSVFAAPSDTIQWPEIRLANDNQSNSRLVIQYNYPGYWL